MAAVLGEITGLIDKPESARSQGDQLNAVQNAAEGFRAAINCDGATDGLNFIELCIVAHIAGRRIGANSAAEDRASVPVARTFMGDVQGARGVIVDGEGVVLPTILHVVQKQLVSAIHNIAQEDGPVVAIVGNPEVAVEHLGVRGAGTSAAAPRFIRVKKDGRRRRRADRVIQGGAVNIVAVDIIPIGERDKARNISRKQLGRCASRIRTLEVDGDAGERGHHGCDEQAVNKRKYGNFAEDICLTQDLVFHKYF